MPADGHPARHRVGVYEEAPVLESALAYAERGWHVFPCLPSKAPAVDQGLNVATVDPDQIRAWWTNHPDRLIGVNCGRSNLAVIDVDDHHGYGTFCDDHGDPPDTLTAETPSGGFHLIFAGDIKSTVSRVAPGVDTRGRGGYIIVPPSPGYAWVNRRKPADLPAAYAEAADPPRPEPAAPPDPAGQANTRWGERVLEAEVARIATAADGTRNHTLFGAACKVYEAVKGGHIEEQVATGHLEAVALRVGLDRHEVDASLASAWDRTGERHPEPRGPEPAAPALTDAPRTSVEVVDVEADDARQRFDVYDLHALRNLPPPSWMLPHRIPEGLTWMVGHPGVGKSLLALDWTATVAARGQRVLYFAGEGASGFARRVDAWSKVHSTADLSPFLVVPTAPQLLNPDHAQLLYTTVQHHRIDLVVIDTWSRATAGGDENSHSDVTRALHVLDELREAYGTSTVVVHHTNASGARPRGHTSIEGAADAIWQVEQDDELAAGQFTVRCRKMKDAAPPPEILARITPHDDSIVVQPSVYDRQGIA